MKQYEKKDKIAGRKQAGILLAEGIAKLNLVDAVVIGVPRGGVAVAAAIADQLRLPLEIMSCRTVQDPVDRSKVIGSVSAGEASFHDYPRSLQQDSLYLKTVTLRNEMRYEHDFYYGGEATLDVGMKTVILVEDQITSTDEIFACIAELKRQRPLKIIVAVPFITDKAATAIDSQVDELIYLKAQASIRSPFEFYEDFPNTDDWTVRTLLQQAKQARALTPRK